MVPGRATDTIRVLHVDDEPDFVDMVATFLQREDSRLTVETATSADDALDRLADGAFDCVISDHDMPGRDGIDFLETFRDEYPDLPFILYTGKGSEEVASKAISAGVTEYLQKESGTGQYPVLANRITNAVEQYRSKRAVEESQKRLSLFVEQSPFAVVEWDENFAFARLNDKAEDVLGYSEAELVGESWEAIVPGSDRDAVGEVVSELLEAGGGYHSINENVRADGERIICEWHNRVVTDEDGETVAIFSQFQDITDRRDRQRQLELRNRAINEAPVGITITDPAREDNPIIFANDQFVEYAGYPREAVLGENPRILQGPETEPEPVAAMRDAIDNEEPVRVELRNASKDGTVWWNRVSIAPLRDDEGSVQHYVGFQEDITDRKRYEERLSTVARRFEAIFENPLTLIALLRPDGTVLEINRTALDLVDVSADEVTGETFSNTPWWTHSETAQEQLQDWVGRAADGEHVRFEAKHPVSDGDMATIDGLIHPVHDDDGAVTELVAIGRNITENKDREQALQRERDRLDEFAGIVSHDLRSPLTVAQGRTTLLAETLDDANVEGVDEYIDSILHALDRMEDIIEDSLTLAKQGQPVSDPEPIALANAARDSWDAVETADATLTVAVGDDTILADPSRLRSVFENLFRNSVEHGSTSGRTASDDSVEHGYDESTGLTVTVGRVDPFHTSTRAPTDSEGFYVEDDGTGVPPGARENVFDTGHTTSDGGTGFGLAIVDGIAEAHGWDVQLSEGTNGGARFTFTGVEFPE